MQTCDELNLTILNIADTWQQPTRPSSGSVVDLAITNRPDIFSLRIGLLPLPSDHTSLSVMVRAAVAAPVAAASLLPPRWRLGKVDWELYNYCDQHFSPIAGEVTSLLDSLPASPASSRQGIFNKVAGLLQDAFLALASQVVPRELDGAKRVSPSSARFQHHLSYTHRVHNKLRAASLRVNADREAGVASEARERTLKALRSAYARRRVPSKGPL